MNGLVIVVAAFAIALCGAMSEPHRGDVECSHVQCDKMDDDDSHEEEMKAARRRFFGHGDDDDDENLSLNHENQTRFNEYWEQCRRQKQQAYETCCEEHEEHRHKKIKLAVIIGAVLLLLVGGIVTGCCIYRYKCKPKRTKTHPDNIGTPVIAVANSQPSAPGKQLPAFEAQEYGTNMPPAYATLPATPIDNPRDLIVSPPPPYTLQKY